MNEKGRVMIWVIAGGYLAYLGAGLLKNIIAGTTDNPIMYGGFGIAFFIIGVGYIVYSIKRYKDADVQDEEHENKED